MKLALIVVGVSACTALAASVVLLTREKTAGALLQLLGAGFLIVMFLSHVAEALQLAPWMGWGLANSVGHWLDLSSAIAGLTLLPLGYFVRRRANHRTPA